jgi:hypothetical protein
MMKNIIFLIVLIMGSHLCISQTIRIEGKIVLGNENDKVLVIEKTKIILKQNGFEQIATVNNELGFSFEINSFEMIEITAIPKGIGNISGRSYTFKNIEMRESDTIKIDFPYSLTCKYDKSIENKTCPICKKQDEVIPISYGLISEESNKLLEGNNTNKYKSGGCVVSDCDPNWFCQRDKLDF